MTLNPNLASLPEISNYLDRLTSPDTGDASIRVMKVPGDRGVTLKGAWTRIERCRLDMKAILENETGDEPAKTWETDDHDDDDDDYDSDSSPPPSVEISVDPRVMRHLRKKHGPELERAIKDNDGEFSWDGKAPLVVIKAHDDDSLAELREKFDLLYCIAQSERTLIKETKKNPKDHRAPEMELEPDILMTHKSQEGIQLIIVRGNIIDQHVDAIVSPADPKLQHRHTLAKSIAQAAGDELRDDCASQIAACGDLELGTAVASSGGNLHCSSVIHAVGPANHGSIWRDLRNACVNSFRVAASLKFQSVAVPLLGFVSSTSDVARMASIMFEAFDTFSFRNPGCSVDEIRFVDDDVGAVGAWCEEMQRRYGRGYDYESFAQAGPRPRVQAESLAFSPPSGSSREDFKDDVDSGDERSRCPICLAPIDESKRLDCGHTFCTICVEQELQVRSKCPVCKRPYGEQLQPEARGLQPEGTMSVRKGGFCLPGHDGFGTITITYHFQGGIQGSEHPRPGRRYGGTTRSAYLPDSPEGNEILGLLRKAFDAKLIFTIGTSETTGIEDQITWSDISHKTSQHGGPTQYVRSRLFLAAKLIKIVIFQIWIS